MDSWRATRWVPGIIAMTMVLTSIASFAGDYEDGWLAFDRGEYETAAALFSNAAEAGNADAQLTLGWLYEQGTGLAQDDMIAALWYRAAADQGMAEAQHALGALYEHGRGVEQDIAAAARWYGAAAAQGHGSAQAALNRLLANAAPEPIGDPTGTAADSSAMVRPSPPGTDDGPVLTDRSNADIPIAATDSHPGGTTTTTEPTPANESATVQLAAMNTRTGAESVWQFLLGRYGDLLVALEPRYVAAPTSSGRTIVQIHAVIDSIEAAETLCRALRNRGGDCLIVN